MRYSKKILTLFLSVCLLASLIFVLPGCKTENKKTGAESTTVWSETDNYTLSLSNGEVVCTDNDYVVCIEKKPNEDFVILNLADIQLDEFDWILRSMSYQTSTKTIAKLIAEVKPDLITLTGDQSYGEERAISNLISYLDTFGIPWAPVFGNHDNQEDDSRISYQAELYKASKYCLFRSGANNLAVNENGSVAIGNYIVNVVEKDPSLPCGFAVINSLILLNSRSEALTTKQVEWYKWAVSGVQPYGRNGETKSTVVLHIPIKAYEYAFKAAFNNGVSPDDETAYYQSAKEVSVFESHSNPTIWNDGYENSFGVCHRAVRSEEDENYVFEAIKDFDDNSETDFVSTTLMLCGHDHINNFVIEYEGVKLAYATHTGSGCYWEEEINGGSVITVADSGDTTIYNKYIQVSYTVIPIWAIVCICVVGAAAIAFVAVFLVRRRRRAGA